MVHWVGGIFNMLLLLSLRDVIEALATCDSNNDVWSRYSWVYVKDGAPLIEARFYLSSPEEESNSVPGENGEQMPAFAVAHGLSYCLEAADFVDVLSVQKRQQPLSQLEDYAAALEHYVERDAFLDRGEFYSGRCVDQQPLPGISRDFFPEYDLQLGTCPADRIRDAARVIAQLLHISVADALARCRRLPVILGERTDSQGRVRIETQFIALSLPLQITTHWPLAWLPGVDP